MKKRLAPAHLDNLQIYKAGKPIEELAREKNLTKISKLASNENPLGPSPMAIKAMTRGLWDIHRYPDMHSYKLKSKLAKYFDVKLDNIIIGNGSEGIMGNIARAFIQPGDEIITSENTFIGFNILARSAGANLVTTPMTLDYRFDVVKIAELISDDTKIIYIANPNTPTGTYIRKSEFEYLMAKIPEHILVIIDEAYFEFAEHLDDYPNSMEYRYDNFIALRTFSKAYGLAGVRVGYGFAHERLISYLTKVKLPFEPGFVAQLGAVEALEDQPHLKRTLELNQEEYRKAFDYISNKGLKPVNSVTNFIAFETPSNDAADLLFKELLDYGVIIRPLKANGMPKFLRLSIGTPEEMNHFYRAMDDLVPIYLDKFGDLK